ncbi:glycerophosphodiester phosphodiesterase family protein [Primorskyibacter aestuariivivens]|uniref:glycerophosphodiester phosphodiesterase family protein n=1 Tax=Primorskyibacter aestuariivivens TaxID=1888912 RepID=UPI0022FFDC58|nr:glycerophosphodiester phosphodiesterase family protein [Primorskyibacter aestuariivivens]MDA7430639.1 glycerophosphodiester phosphodiesterase family protein [Primorskyibacter aestuariivivens]
MLKAKGVSLSSAISDLSSHPWVVSHRGDWSEYPENSIEAMLSAAELGADMIEIDAQSAGDGTLLAIHDDHLDRTTGASGPVKSLRVEHSDQVLLKAKDGGNAAPISEYELPTLAGLFEAARGKVLLNIDTKHKSDLDAVCDLVLQTGMEDHVLVKMSVDPDTNGADLKTAAWFGKVHFMPVILDAKRGELVRRITNAAEFLDSQIVEVQFQDGKEFVELNKVLRQQNRHTWINTLDPMHPLEYSDSCALASPDAVWGELIHLGARAIQTDQSAVLARYLGRKSYSTGTDKCR